MISVSSSDARSEIGLGFANIEEEMDDSDFEEESTHSYVSCVDPDVALSYIDEKLENVLGHFQKDFEGGVSAENLGAKFGGYGSFLSVYQISPVCSRPKSPPEVQNHVTKAVTKSSFEGGRSASSLAPEVSISGSASKPPASNADVLVELKKSTKSSSTGTPDSKQQSVTNTPSSAPSSQKTLKLRIKVSSSDLSSLKKVSTYSREGLTMPSSTSQGNCLKEIEEGLLYGRHDSPTKILMAMMSFPFHKDQLLSPLSDDLIHLGEREEIMKDAGYVSVMSDSKNTHVVLGISAAENCAGKFSTGKNEKLKAKAKRIPQSNRLDGNHIGSNAEIKADRLSCEELISKTLRLPLLSCPSMKNDTRFDKVSDSYMEDVEGTTRRTNSIGVNAALVGSKAESKENVVAFPNQSVTETENVTSVKNKSKDLCLTEEDTLRSLKSKSTWEKAPNIEHAKFASMDKVSQSEARNEHHILKPKLPKEQKSQKSSSSLRGKVAAKNIIKANVSDKLQGDIRGSADMYMGFFDSSEESKEENQSSPVLKAEKEKLSEEKILNRKETDDDACNHLHLVSEPDLKHLNESTDSHEDGQNIKLSVKWEATNKNSVEGGIEGMETRRKPDRELSGTSKKLKTGKSRFSASVQPGSNKMLDVVASDKTMIIQASDKKQDVIAKPASHNGSDDRKRKLKETRESRDCMRLSGASVMESSGEKVRKKQRLKGSSCDEKELPLNSDSCDWDRRISPENDRDRVSHRPLKVSSPSLSLRMPDPVKLKAGRRNLLEKDEHDSNSTAGDTVKICIDGEDYRATDRLETNKKGAAFSQNNNLPSPSDGKTMGQVVSSWGKERAYNENCSMDKFVPKKSGEYSGDNCTDGESPQKNREEGSSAPSKEKSRDLDFTSELQDLGSAAEVKTKESRSKKRPPKKVSMESSKEELREFQETNTKLNVNGDHISSQWKPETAKSSSGKSNQLESIEKLKNKSAPSGRDQIEDLSHGSNTRKQIMRNGKISVTHDNGSQNQKQNGSGHKDHVGLSPLKRESTSQAVSNSINEATDLKHMADRLKNGGANSESTGVYFQAALKFLHGASLLESSGTEHAAHKGIARSMHIYGSTAKLCGFCAHEFEKSKDMGAAALAYKCMEVAYLRITYSSHGNISRYKYELQTALQVLPSGESPSFASDPDNSNHIQATEKVALSNSVRSPRVTGNHVISSGNNSSLSQLLAFSQNVSFAMDASRKAQIAFTAAKGNSSDARYSNDGITSIKRALDFNFQDMENLLHLVRLAMESINR